MANDYAEIRNRAMRRLLDNVGSVEALVQEETCGINRNADPPAAQLVTRASVSVAGNPSTISWSTVCDPSGWITFADLTGEDDDDEAETAATERQRIRSLLATFRDDNVSQRRDTELRRVARNALLDELDSWFDGGAVEYTPKD